MTEPLETKSHDLAVVGGGIVGLACAWYAARRGMSVVLLERDRLGAGATQVAAGMLAPVTEADFGEDELLGVLGERFTLVFPPGTRFDVPRSVPPVPSASRAITPDT